MNNPGSVLGTVNVNLWSRISDLFSYGTQPNSLGQLITKLIDVGIIAAVIVGLLFLIVGALNWITAEGKPDKLENARNTVIHAIVGLVIAVAAYVIWIAVVKQFLGIDIQNGVNLGGPPGTGTTPGGGGTGGAGGAGVCYPNMPLNSCGQVSYGGDWYRCVPANTICSSYSRTYDYPFLCPDPTCP